MFKFIAMTFYEFHNKISHFSDEIEHWVMSLEVEKVLLTIAGIGVVVLISWATVQHNRNT